MEKLKEEIKNIKEPRRTSYGNIRHKLEDILIIGLCTILCGGEDFADMEEFGKDRKDFYKNFWNFPMVYQTVTHSDGCLRRLTRLNFRPACSTGYLWNVTDAALWQ